MKLFVLTGVIACQFFLFLPQGMCQENRPGERKLHVQAHTPRGRAVMLAADNIERTTFMIHLQGNVEIKIRPSRPDMDVMVLSADEADYHTDTDEIAPRGRVRLKLEQLK